MNAAECCSRNLSFVYKTDRMPFSMRLLLQKNNYYAALEIIEPKKELDAGQVCVSEFVLHGHNQSIIRISFCYVFSFFTLKIV